MTDKPYMRVEDCSEEDLYWFSGLRDTLLAHAKGYEHGLFLGESPKVIERALNKGCRPVDMLIEEHWLEQSEGLVGRLCAANPDFNVYVATLTQYQRITGFKTARGALTLFERPAPAALEDVLKDAKRVVVLEDITNYTNIGSIFRSCAALGVDAVLISPSCHDPLYRRAARVSMGTVFQVPWAYIGSDQNWAKEGARVLHKHGFELAALALRDDALLLGDKALSSADKLALVMGTEGEGLSEDTLQACDYVVTIPMQNGVDSLNVSAATSIVIWELVMRPNIVE